MAAVRDLPSAGSESTIHAGEVWLVLCNAHIVAPCVIIGAYKQYKNGVRPSPDANKPWLLKDVVTIHIHLFSQLVSQDTDGACTFSETNLGVLRATRNMLTRLDPADVNLSDCVDLGRLTLTSHGTTILGEHQSSSVRLHAIITQALP